VARKTAPALQASGQMGSLSIHPIYKIRRKAQ
jgi:hypothetical protein